MTSRTGVLIVGFGALAFAPGLLAQLVVGSGTAVVQVVTVPANAAVEFSFTGTPSGSITAGESISATGLVDGTHTSTQLIPGADFVLTAITCDDAGSENPSVGDITTRTAMFNIDSAETVTCVFTNTSGSTMSNSGGGIGGGGPAGGDAVNPFEDPDGSFDEFPIPNDVPPTAGTFVVPRAGPWDVQNYPGQMSCGGFSVPLQPSRDRGVIDVLDDGRTVIGTGFSADSAPVRLAAVPGIIGRYAGNAGGEQDGIPMIIEFYWQLITDEWIVGYLTSSVAQQGLVCNMFRTYELEYAGS